MPNLSVLQFLPCVEKGVMPTSSSNMKPDGVCARQISAIVIIPIAKHTLFLMYGDHS